jgi:hypothetical protein
MTLGRAFASLTTPPRDTRRVLVCDATDLLAVDVFERADKTQQPITLAMIERRIGKSNDDKTACRE